MSTFNPAGFDVDARDNTNTNPPTPGTALFAQIFDLAGNLLALTYDDFWNTAVDFPAPGSLVIDETGANPGHAVVWTGITGIGTSTGAEALDGTESQLISGVFELANNGVSNATSGWVADSANRRSDASPLYGISDTLVVPAGRPPISSPEPGSIVLLSLGAVMAIGGARFRRKTQVGQPL